MNKSEIILKSYELAKDQYAGIGVDTEDVLRKLEQVSISLHCWQTDDVTGFENPDATLSGGIQATGNYPGKARTIEEARADLEKVYSLLPGRHRLSLHAIYGDFRNGKAERDKIEPKHFESWVNWAKERGIGLDFNCTMFSHPNADSGFTLSHPDAGIRKFWIDHVQKCREISAYMGKELRTRCVHNIWIPDGSKDLTVNRFKHRALLKESLDEILKKPQDPALDERCS